ncbi:glutamate racemase [Candidatus Peregrinibacteria bacterium]|nr:glutamate racemase [Candidatus Peregrinibacteria bacterium]
MILGPIAIFDSGYGGLTIMKEIISLLPDYDYIYLGDNARTPYGNHGKEIVTRFTEEAVNFLFNQNARLIIIACYTASSLALRELQGKYLRDPKSNFRDRKILGVIKPVVEKAVKESRYGRIGVVGTRATVASGAFEIELKKQKPDIIVSQQSCPLLVPLIEEHWHKKPEAMMILKKYLRPIKNRNIDTLILGCTHYPLMLKDFKRMLGKRIKVLDSGKIVAESLTDYLKRHPEIESQLSTGGTKKFYTTDDVEKFRKFSNFFTNIETKEINKINLNSIPIQ